MFAQSNYNYERLQATAFAHSMLPIMKKLYSNDKKSRKMEYKDIYHFLIQSLFVNLVIHGITIAMEEEKANGKPISQQAF